MAEDNNQDWRAGLPLEYRTNDTLAKFKDIGSLAKSYLEMETFVSSTGRLPKSDAKAEDWDKFYKSWGRPEKHEEYKLPELPKEYQLEDDFKGPLMQMAHQLGLNQKQFEQMINWGLNTSKALSDRQLQVKQNAQNELKKKWGFAAERNQERARRTIAMLVDMKKDDPFVQWLESKGYDDDPTVMEFFYNLSQRLGEDSFVDESVKKEQSDQQAAMRRINEVMADLKGPYYNEQDARHKDIVAEVAGLYKTAYPE